MGFLVEVPPRISALLSMGRFNEVHKEKAVGFSKGQHPKASEGARSHPFREHGRWEQLIPTPHHSALPLPS